MKETWTQANKRRACFDCGESDADPYTYGERSVRVCRLCLHRWTLQPLKARTFSGIELRESES
jgi:hypothetical protein